MTALSIVVGVVLAPFWLAIIFGIASLCWHLAREPFDREKRALRRDIDRLMQREWDLVNQLNAVGRHERLAWRREAGAVGNN